MTDLENALDRLDAWLKNASLAAWTQQDLRQVRWAARRFANLTSEETKKWLCREGEKVHDWAFGVHNEPHCWFNGPTDHNPECGEYFVLRSVEEGTE